MTDAGADRLCVEDVTAGYGRRTVLHGLTLPPLAAGTVTALVGPNGAGKSTLLRAIAGLVSAQGSIRLGSLDLLRSSATQHAARVAFMPQVLPQLVALTVFEATLSAMKAGASHGLTVPRDLQARAVAILARVGMTSHAHRPLDSLSGGERQLASLAQALTRDPALLLLDEPTSALDLGHQVSVMSLVRDVAAEGRIVIVVLHDLNLAVRWADQVVVLKAGHLAAVGAPIEALTADVLAQTYGVEARIERCTRGRVQVLVDGLIPPRTS
jgi:iron complex transport system ATP-binding protein